MSETIHTPVRSEGNSTPTWRRGLFMLLFIIFFGIAETALALMAVAQFFWLLFTGEPNRALRSFGVSLGNWMLEVADFQTCVTEEKPFPWKPWPASDE